tara:strand:+ start:1469 stop:1609 length:141 start_codon:yes stop_codon:yes gene_type:complete
LDIGYKKGAKKILINAVIVKMWSGSGFGNKIRQPPIDARIDITPKP